MLQIDNMTRFEAERAVQYDHTGTQVWVVVVKGTFEIGDDGSVELAALQEPVAVTATYAGAPGVSHMLRDGELVPAHPGTDVTVNAIARAPHGEPVPTFEASVAVGRLRKHLTITGARMWERGQGGLRSTPPEPFVSLPVKWEHAFGGADRESGDSESRNPAGAGFYTSAASAIGGILPRVEAPGAHMTAWHDRPAPAGLGAMAPGWSPRRERGGTFDNAWSEERAPLWPDDHDVRFHCCAADGLWAEDGLRGGERVTLNHLADIPLLSFVLPRVFLGFTTRLGDAAIRGRQSLDRVIIEPGRRRLMMVWRSALPLGARAREVSRTIIIEKQNLS